jgi:hypothetical protein
MGANNIFDRDDGDEDAKEPKAVPRSQIRFTEWDCPACDANNPLDDGFKHSDEIICNWCGANYRVETVGEERFKLIPI